jgi:RimJ/RimL family protein N-acetyltransferase
MRIFLETNRLVLRRFTQDDVDNIVRLNGDPEVMRYLTGGRPTPREVVRDQIIPGWLTYYEQYEGYGFWAAIEKATEEFLGWFHFRPPRTGRKRMALPETGSSWDTGCVVRRGARGMPRRGLGR